MNAEQEHCVEEKEVEQPEKRKRIVLASLAEYLKKQKEEMLGHDNEWYTGEELDRQPTEEEMAQHYVMRSEGAKNFAKRYTYVGACEPWEQEEREDEKEKNE